MVNLHTMPNKTDIIRKFLPDKVTDIITVQIDLDTTQLGIADVFRNLNKAYPQSTRERANIRDGRLVIGILCKSELILPYKGIIFLVTNDETDVKGTACKYILYDPKFLSKAYLVNDKIKRKYVNAEIFTMCQEIGIDLAKNVNLDTKKYPEFYQKYVYDDYEMERYKHQDDE